MAKTLDADYLRTDHMEEKCGSFHDSRAGVQTERLFRKLRIHGAPVVRVRRNEVPGPLMLGDNYTF